jgi:hypothetical protein
MLSRRRLLLRSAAGAIAATVVRPAAAQASVRWIDVHMHLVGRSGNDFVEAARNALQAMDQFGIQTAVVFSPPMPVSNFAFTDYLPALRQFPGRFAFLAGGESLNPMIQQTPAASVTPQVKQRFTDQARRILDAGALGFGEIAVLHLSLVPNHPFEQVPAVHPLLLAMMEVANERKAVIDLHMDPVVDPMPTPSDLKSPPNPKQLAGNVAQLETLLAHGPDARLMWAHGGSDFTGNMTPALIERLMTAHPNLGMSLRPIPLIAATQNPFGHVYYNLMLSPQGIAPDWLALLQKFPDRFVMGGDTFFVSSGANPQAAVVSLGKGNDPRLRAAQIALSRMPEELRPKIAIDNARALYRM